MASDTPTLTYVGHATVLLRLGGLGVLIDPLLVGRLGPIKRVAPPVRLDELEDVALILLTHAHLDHFSVSSLRRLSRRAELVLPAGTARLVKNLGFAAVHEIVAGEEVPFGSLRVRGQPALHRGRRHPAASLTPSLGYEVRGEVSVYHAGDTGVVPEPAAFAGRPDVVCLPVSGYGARLPEDHMGPRTASVAVETLDPRLAVPIHWGTYQLQGMTRRMRERDLWRPHAFASAVGALGNGTRVCVLQPGESLALTPEALGAAT